MYPEALPWAGFKTGSALKSSDRTLAFCHQNDSADLMVADQSPNLVVNLMDPTNVLISALGTS